MTDDDNETKYFSDNTKKCKWQKGCKHKNVNEITMRNENIIHIYFRLKIKQNTLVTIKRNVNGAKYVNKKC